MVYKIIPTTTVITEEAILKRRCSILLKNHRARAKKDGQVLDYGLRDLMQLVDNTKTCDYCGKPLPWEIQVDHRVPSCRDFKAHRYANLAVCHVECNERKGKLTDAEYLRLLELLEGFHPTAMDDVLRRLRAGGPRYQGRRKGG